MEANNKQPLTPWVMSMAIAAGAFWGGTGIAQRFSPTSTNHGVEISRTSPSVVYRRSQPSLTASEVLKGLQDSFGLSISQLAQVAHVSRPTVYDWLKDGDVQRTDKAQRLDDLIKVLAACDKGNVDSKNIGRLLRRPTVLGSSMLDLLSEPKLDVASIKQAYQTLKHEALASYASMQRMAEKRKTIAVKHTPEEMGDNLSQFS